MWTVYIYMEYKQVDKCLCGLQSGCGLVNILVPFLTDNGYELLALPYSWAPISLFCASAIFHDHPQQNKGGAISMPLAYCTLKLLHTYLDMYTALCKVLFVSITLTVIFYNLFAFGLNANASDMWAAHISRQFPILHYCYPDKS